MAQLGISATGRSVLGAPNWGGNVTQQLRNIKCQRMQLITIKENVECQRLLLSCEFSSRSQWFPKRIFMSPGDAKVELLSPAISASMWLDWRTDGSVTMLPGYQGCELSNFSIYDCVTMDGNLTRVHSACSMLLRMLLEQRWKAAMKRTVCCYDSRCDVYENFWDLMVWQTSCWNGCDVVLKVVMSCIRGIEILNK